MTDYTPHGDFAQPADGAGQEVAQSNLNAALDRSLNKPRELDITGDTTLSAEEFHQSGLLILGGTPSGDFDLNLPAVTANEGLAAEHQLTFKNTSGKVATIQVTGGGGANVTLPPGEIAEVQTDGTDVELLVGAQLVGGTTALATDAVGGFTGMPTMAGDATGTPTNESPGFAPVVYDTTNQELKIYDPVANAWRVIATVAQ